MKGNSGNKGGASLCFDLLNGTSPFTRKSSAHPNMENPSPRRPNGSHHKDRVIELKGAGVEVITRPPAVWTK
jgi:hypothetical protein